MTKEELEGYLAEGLSLERIGRRVGRNPSTISYHLKKHGLKPVNAGKHAARGGIPELKLRTLVATGAPMREVARQLNRSYSTVRYWLERYGIDYHGIKGNREKALAARAGGETVIQLRCRHHGPTDFYVSPNGDYKCKRCRKERVAQWRRNAKDDLVREAGGRCVLCGYDNAWARSIFIIWTPRRRHSDLRCAVTRSPLKSSSRRLANAFCCAPTATPRWSGVSL
jgi:DNA-binding CsgD family transcriptional regulator